jgi:hypothetical protein
MCREMTPTLPWAGLASRAPRSAFLAVRAAGLGTACERRKHAPMGARALAPWSSGGIVMVATSLPRVSPGPPAGPFSKAEGFASTAVSPFY